MNIGQRLLGVLAAFVFTLGACQAFAQGVDLDGWDFNSQPELVERLNETRANLNNKIEEARDVDNTGVESELKQARDNIDKAIEEVQSADEENWEDVRTNVEYALTDYDYYGYGIWDDDYWAPGL